MSSECQTVWDPNVRPDLGLNCLRTLSAVEKVVNGRQSVNQEIFSLYYCFCLFVVLSFLLVFFFSVHENEDIEASV